MKEITYAGTTFVTGDRIASSLLNLVEKLGTATATMNIEVPAVDDNKGDVRLIDFIIGPSSEMIAVPIESAHDEILDDGVVENLDHLAGSLQLAHPVAAAPDDQFDYLDLPDENWESKS